MGNDIITNKKKELLLKYFWVNDSATIGLIPSDVFKGYSEKLGYEFTRVDTDELLMNKRMICWKDWGYDIELFNQACNLATALGSLVFDVILPINKHGPMFFEICSQEMINSKHEKIYVVLGELIIFKDGRELKYSKFFNERISETKIKATKKGGKKHDKQRN